MPLSLTDDVKTVSELKQGLRDVLAPIKETGRPVVVTVKGKPDAVLIDVESDERKLNQIGFPFRGRLGQGTAAAGRRRP